MHQASQNFPSYFFSNNTSTLKKALKRGWIPIDYEPTTHEDDPVLNNLDAKVYKVRPHLHPTLNRYEYIFFLDSKIRYNERALVNFLTTRTEKAMFMIAHMSRTRPFLQNEFNESMNQERYAKQRDQILRFISTHEDESTKEPDTFYQMSMILRKNAHPNTKDIGELWHDMIRECGIQDQISFYFVQQKFDHVIGVLPLYRIAAILQG